jgi:hypothetical protein
MERKDMIPNPDDLTEVEIWKDAWSKGRNEGSRYHASSEGLKAVIKYRNEKGIPYSEERSFK